MSKKFIPLQKPESEPENMIMWPPLCRQSESCQKFPQNLHQPHIQKRQYQQRSTGTSWRASRRGVYYPSRGVQQNVGIRNMSVVQQIRQLQILKNHRQPATRAESTTAKNFEYKEHQISILVQVKNQRRETDCGETAHERASQTKAQTRPQWVHSYRRKGERIIIVAINKWWRYCRYRCYF